MATFHGDCTGARVSWSYDGQSALVWFDPTQRSGTVLYTAGDPSSRQTTGPASGATLQFAFVDLPSHQTRALTVPGLGTLKTVAFDRQGRGVALTMEDVSGAENAGTRSLVFEGKKLPLNPDLEGVPVLVHAYRLASGDRWERIETKASTTGSDVAPEVRVLNASKDLSMRSTELLTPHLGAASVTDSALLARLHQAEPKLVPNDEGNWVQVAAGPGSVLIWQANAEFTFTMGQLFFLSGAQLTAPPQLDRSASDVVAVMVRDSSVLVATDTIGTRPRLYDVGSVQILFHSDTAWAATYWPAAERGV